MLNDQRDIVVQSDPAPAGSDQTDFSDDILEVQSLHSQCSVDEDQGDSSSVPEMARQIILELFFGEEGEKLEDGNHIKDVKDARIESDLSGKSTLFTNQQTSESSREMNLALRITPSHNTGLNYR